jgi:hypothetical protein
MYKAIFNILFTCLFFCFTGNAQSLTSKQASDLQNTLHGFFDKNIPRDEKNPLLKVDPPSEAFLCLLSIDSIGRVDGVHFLGENRFKDCAYSIFSTMRATDFKNWKVEKCKGKTIVIPILILSRIKSHYELLKEAGLDAYKSGEMGNLIISRGVDFSWPYSIKETPPGTIKVSDDKTKH